MTKYTVGQKVKFPGNGEIVFGAVEGLLTVGADVRTDNGRRMLFGYGEIRPAEGFYPMEGETVVMPGGEERFVFASVGDVFFTSYDAGAASWWSRSECASAGWTIKGQAPKKYTVTLDEVADKFGYPRGKVEVSR